MMNTIRERLEYFVQNCRNTDDMLDIIAQALNAMQIPQGEFGYQLVKAWDEKYLTQEERASN